MSRVIFQYPLRLILLLIVATGTIGGLAHAQPRSNPEWDQRKSQQQVARFDLTSANGWTITAVPTEPAFTDGGSYYSLLYQVEFFRPNETSPFETADGTLTIDFFEPQDSFAFSLRSTTALASQAEVDAINEQIMSDEFQSLSEAEQDAVFARSEAAVQRMMQELLEGSDPAARDNFGCQSFTLMRGGSDEVSGMLACGKNVGEPAVSGTMTPVR
jgi:hypothetical protein